jgi:hypothetical protein
MISTLSPAGIILRVLHAFIYANQLIINYVCYVFIFLTLPAKTPRLQNMCQDAKFVCKLPVHVGVLVAEAKVSLCDLARIVVWCYAAGISHISIYDRKGDWMDHNVN